MHALPFRADVPTARLAHDLPRNVSPQGSHAPSDDLPSSLQTHGGSPDGEKASNSEEIERPDETLRAAAKEETPANRSDTGGGLPTNPQHRRGLPNSMLFRHPRSRRKLGGHGARARRMRGWAARAASATHGANPAQPRRAGKTPNATERVPKRPFSTNVSRETSAAVTRAPTATQPKTPAPRSGTGASCAKRRAVYTSATQRPCRLQYSYTLRASSPSAMAKSATGASSGVSSTIW